MLPIVHTPEGDVTMHVPRRLSRTRIARAAAMIVPAAAAIVLFAGSTAYANVTLTQVSHDIYTDAQAQHNTEVEPDTFTFGTTIVSAFQVGRVSGGGSSNIGWATSTNSGATWTHGYLPGITTNGGGTFGQASDAAVAFDAKHNVWLISSIGISGSSVVRPHQPLHRRRPDLGQPGHHRDRCQRQELDRLRRHRHQRALRQLLHRIRHHQLRRLDPDADLHRRRRHLGIRPRARQAATPGSAASPSCCPTATSSSPTSRCPTRSAPSGPPTAAPPGVPPC